MCLAETLTGVGPAPLGDLPVALVDDPVDEGSDRVRQRLLDRAPGDVAPRVRRRHRQRDDRRLAVDAWPVTGERDVARLQRQVVAGHHGRERGVHERLDLRHAAKARRQVHKRGAPLLDPAADLAIDGDVGAAEAVDRLLGIADDEEAAGLRLRLAPVGLARIVGGEEQEDLGLQRIGVLELVDEDALEAALEALAHAPVVAHQVARDEQQIEKIERAVLRLHLAIALQRARELLLQERREVGVGGHAELVEPPAQVGDRAQHLVARARPDGTTRRVRA